MKDRKDTIRILLAVLAALSLFSGIKINGLWGWPYQYIFFEGLKRVMREVDTSNGINYSWALHWLLTLITTLTIVSFPFIFHRIKHFMVWLIIVPLLFLILEYNVSLIFVFLPFAVIWIILIEQMKKLNRLKAGVQIG